MSGSTRRRGWGWIESLRRHSDLALALAVAAVVGMMILPLPTIALDLLITLNLATAVVLLLVAIYVGDALKITTFPTILLVTTLFRLGLNVSTTRLILLQADAGRVIDAFGDFVVRGDFVVGAVVFFILLVVQYVVIARGSERVAEVAARFTLDALPGHQMAIDADLRSHLIDREEARRRRRALSRECQFYGAMDGAMRFVKGDAVAGIIITLVNIIAGLIIGVTQRGLSLAEALRLYGLLTIGDGLVSQIPALVISTAAGLVITRVASEERDHHLAQEISGQVMAHPRALAVTAGLLGLLAIVPGLPAFPFLVLALIAAVAAAATIHLRRRAGRGERPSTTEESEPLDPAPIALALGPATGVSAGPAAAELEALRRQLTRELGLRLPSIHLRQRAAEAPGQGFALLIDDVPEASGDLPAAAEALPALVAEVERALRRRAQLFVGLQQTHERLDELSHAHPELVRAAVPEVVSLPLATEVLRRLVDEGVSIANLRLIVEALLEWGEREQDPVALTELVRSKLSRQLTHQVTGGARSLAVHLVSPDIEAALRSAIQRSSSGTYLALDPSLARDITDAVAHAVGPEPAVIVTSTEVRRYLRKLIEPHLPTVTVLAHGELEPELDLEVRSRIDL